MNLETRRASEPSRIFRAESLGWPVRINCDDLVELLEHEIGSRDRRAAIFGSDLFHDPAWDIVLDLARASLVGGPVFVSSVCYAARAPNSTALRHLRQLVKQGFVLREPDPTDGRRSSVRLTGAAMAAVARYLRGGMRNPRPFSACRN